MSSVVKQVFGKPKGVSDAMEAQLASQRAAADKREKEQEEEVAQRRRATRARQRGRGLLAFEGTGELGVRGSDTLG